MKKNAGNEEAAQTPPPGAEKSAPEQGTAGTDAEAGTGKTTRAPDAVTGEGAENGNEAGKAAGEAKPEGADLAARIAELERLNADLQDQYLRKAADFDNYRKRMIKEKQEAIDFANANLLVDLVQILDNFDRAIAAGGVHEPGTPVAAFADGIGMIRNQLGGMLENKYGLSHYPVVGASFDPTIHEAISSLPSPDVTEPTVHDEFVKGYKLKDRVIRVAKVSVRMPGEAAKQ